MQNIIKSTHDLMTGWWRSLYGDTLTYWALATSQTCAYFCVTVTKHILGVLNLLHIFTTKSSRHLDSQIKMPKQNKNNKEIKHWIHRFGNYQRPWRCPFFSQRNCFKIAVKFLWNQILNEITLMQQCCGLTHIPTSVPEGLSNSPWSNNCIKL